MKGILDMPSGIDVNKLKSNTVSGRPKKDTKVTEACLEDITSRATLRRQVGMTMDERALEINQKFRTELKKYDLRKLYKNNRITKQKIIAHVAPIKFRSNELQQEQLDIIK